MNDGLTRPSARLTDAVELIWSLLAAPAASKLAAAVTPASSVAIVCLPKSPLGQKEKATTRRKTAARWEGGVGFQCSLLLALERHAAHERSSIALELESDSITVIVLGEADHEVEPLSLETRLMQNLA